MWYSSQEKGKHMTYAPLLFLISLQGDAGGGALLRCGGKRGDEAMAGRGVDGDVEEHRAKRTCCHRHCRVLTLGPPGSLSVLMHRVAPRARRRFRGSLPPLPASHPAAVAPGSSTTRSPVTFHRLVQAVFSF